MTGGSRPCTGRPTWRTTTGERGEERERNGGGRGGVGGLRLRPRVRGCVPLPISLSPLCHTSPSYLEIYEYLLSQGADPTIRTKDYDPYLDPGHKTPAEVAVPDPAVRAALAALEARYAGTPKARRPHPDIGCWWTLYDYGLNVVKGWAADYVHPYPGEREEERGMGARREGGEEGRRSRNPTRLGARSRDPHALHGQQRKSSGPRTRRPAGPSGPPGPRPRPARPHSRMAGARSWR